MIRSALQRIEEIFRENAFEQKVKETEIKI